MNNRLSKLLGLSVATLLGVVVGALAQSNSSARLAKLAGDRAEISKMDLVLLNTKISVLQEMLKDDLSLPFVPTSFSYDDNSKKIRISVHVDPAGLRKTDATQLTKTLETRATNLCVAPAIAEGNLPYMMSIQPPKEYCSVRFFTMTLDSSSHVQPRDVAVYEGGSLTLK